MVVYSFYIFDRHASTGSKTAQSTGLPDHGQQTKALSAEDDAKLVFGTIFSLRNMVRKLGGPDDQSVTLPQFTLRPVLETDKETFGFYKLHYYETPTSLKFVMVTDTRTNNLRIVLHQIYVSLYVEYVVKNPLSPIEHPGGVGVNCEMFELGVEQFVVRTPKKIFVVLYLGPD
ncbi:MAG: hypothetical protein Q9167_002671 [Letrouitia subvulpina]